MWRIWTTQLRWGKVPFCNNLMVARAQWAFQVSQGSVETLFRWGGERLTILQQMMYQISSELPELYRRDYRKTFWSLFWSQCRPSIYSQRIMNTLLLSSLNFHGGYNLRWCMPVISDSKQAQQRGLISTDVSG